MAKKGEKLSEETRQRMSEAAKGRKLSPEARAKISAARRGRAPAAHTLAALADANRRRGKVAPGTKRQKPRPPAPKAANEAEAARLQAEADQWWIDECKKPEKRRY